MIPCSVRVFLSCQLPVVLSRSWYTRLVSVAQVRHLIRWLDNCFVPVQCTENPSCFPWGKRAAIVRRYPAFLYINILFFSYVSCFPVSIIPALRSTLSRHIHMGSLTCTHIWVRGVQAKVGQAQNKSAQELTLREREKLLICLFISLLNV